MAAMVQSVKRVLSRYATFSGRASRPEFWWWVLATFIAQLVTQALDAMLFGNLGDDPGQPISMVLALAIFLPGIAVAARRLHDVGKSGWWLLLALIPILGVLVLVYFYVQPSEAGPNEFGLPDPLPRD